MKLSAGNLRLLPKPLARFEVAALVHEEIRDDGLVRRLFDAPNQTAQIRALDRTPSPTEGEGS